MGHADRPEEEDKGYEGCSESDGGSDVDQPSHSQVQCYRVLVAVSVATSFVSLHMLSGWKTR